MQNDRHYNKSPSREDVSECQGCLNVCLIFATAPLFLNLVIHFICVNGLWSVSLCYPDTWTSYDMRSELFFYVWVVVGKHKRMTNQTSYLMGFFLFRRRATIQTVHPATLHGYI